MLGLTIRSYLSVTILLGFFRFTEEGNNRDFLVSLHIAALKCC